MPTSPIKQIIIHAIHRVLAKKFIAWAMASAALFTHFITGDNWMAITMLFIGTQGVLDWKNPAALPPALKEM